MRAARLVRRGRRLAATLMVDAGTLKRVNPQSEWTTDPTTGVVTPTNATIYTGKGRIQTNDPYESRPEAAEHVTVTARDVLQLPMSVLGVKVGDVWTTTESELDPDQVGRVWRIVGPSRKTHQTMRRFYVEEIVQ
jgi:hypothetical protein